jgi:hypothetical protein
MKSFKAAEPAFLIFAKMKCFMLIFSVYMLLLSGLPCGDADECRNPAAEGVSTTADHKDHHREKDNCTPFCNCACCTAPVSIQQPVTYKFVKPAFAVNKYPVINIRFTSSNLSSIWQPPRLS